MVRSRVMLLGGRRGPRASSELDMGWVDQGLTTHGNLIWYTITWFEKQPGLGAYGGGGVSNHRDPRCELHQKMQVFTLHGASKRLHKN
jgi:hypothetical protein